MYGSRKSAGSSVLRAFSASKACLTLTLDELAAWRHWTLLIVIACINRPKPPNLRSRRCAWPRAAKARASVDVVGKNVIDTTRCCHLPSYNKRGWRRD